MIAEEVIAIIKEITPLKDIEIKMDAHLAKELNIGSIAVIKLMNALEKKFAIQLDEEDLIDENFVNPAALTGLIEKKLIKQKK